MGDRWPTTVDPCGCRRSRGDHRRRIPVGARDDGHKCWDTRLYPIHECIGYDEDDPPHASSCAHLPRIRTGLASASPPEWLRSRGRGWRPSLRGPHDSSAPADSGRRRTERPSALGPSPRDAHAAARRGPACLRRARDLRRDRRGDLRRRRLHPRRLLLQLRGQGGAHRGGAPARERLDPAGPHATRRLTRGLPQRLRERPLDDARRPRLAGTRSAPESDRTGARVRGRARGGRCRRGGRGPLAVLPRPAAGS